MEAQFAIQRQKFAPGVKVRKVSHPGHALHGQLGVFATKPFQRGQRVGEYCGLIKCHYKNHRGHDILMPDDVEEDESYNATLVEDDALVVFVDSLEYGNEFRYLNDPMGMTPRVTSNAELKAGMREGRMVVDVNATRDIRKGEQIMIDYGEEYWHLLNKKSGRRKKR
eukprot:jgi/Mesvir1/20144/Mv13383-RA.1